MSDQYKHPTDLKLGDVIHLPVTLFGKGGRQETRLTAFAVARINPEGTGVAVSAHVAYGRCGRTGTKLWRADLTAVFRHGSWWVDKTYYRLNRNTGVVHSWNDVDPSNKLLYARETPAPVPAGAFDDCYSG